MAKQIRESSIQEEKDRSPVQLLAEQPPTDGHAIEHDAATLEHIRALAYELYEQRGREDGHSEEDWLKAESILLGPRADQDAA